jgi:hypothetical protein
MQAPSPRVHVTVAPLRQILSPLRNSETSFFPLQPFSISERSTLSFSYNGKCYIFTRVSPLSFSDHYEEAKSRGVACDSANREAEARPTPSVPPHPPYIAVELLTRFSLADNILSNKTSSVPRTLVKKLSVW